VKTLTIHPGQTTSARGAMAALALCTLLASLGTSSANIALPALAHTFDASFGQVQWVVLAYLLAVTTLIVSVGRLGDIAGRRRLLGGGIALFTLASLLCAVAPSLWLLIAARAGQGLGAAVMMALGMAFVGEAVPKEKTGGAMGLLASTSAVGTALGPSLGGLLIDTVGWRAIFMLNLPLGAAALLLAWRFLPHDTLPHDTLPHDILPHDSAARAGASRFDVLGTLLLALTLGAYALALTLGRGHAGWLSGALLAGAAMGAVAFVLAQQRAASPMLSLPMLRDRRLRASLIMSALVSTVMMATLVVGPFYLARAFALAASGVGLVLAAGPVAAALAGVPAGRLTDRYGAARMTFVGLAGMAAGCVALALVPQSLGVAGYLGAIVLITIHFTLFQTANNTAVMAEVEAGRRGVVSGVLNVSRNLGFLTGASVMGAAFAWGSGGAGMLTASPADVAQGLRVTFLLGGAVIGLAALAGRPGR
jgi:MFS family permease